MYLQGRDRHYRPCVAINVVIAQNAALSDPQMVLTTISLFWEYIIHHMLLPGRIENICMIMNHENMSVTQFSTKFMKQMQAHTGANYKGRARTVFLLNAPSTFVYVWNTIKYFFDQNQERKVAILF